MTRIIRKTVVGGLITGLLLIVSVTIMAGLVLGTSTGNRWLIEQAKDWLPGQLTLEQWQGHLLDTVTLSGLQYRHDQLSVTLDQAELTLAPRALLQGWIDVQRLTLGTLHIHTASTPNRPQSAVALPQRLSLPIGIRIETLGIHSLQLDDSELVGDLQGQRLVAWRRFHIARLHARTLADTRLTLTARGSLTGPIRLDAQADWNAPLPDNGTVTRSQASGRLLLSGALDQLTVTHQLEQPATIASHGNIQWRDGEPRLDLTHRWQAQLLPLDQAPPLTLGDGQFTTRGTLATLQISGHTRLIRDQLSMDINLQGQRIDNGLSLSQLTLTQPQQQLTASGEVLYAPLRWDLEMEGSVNPAIVSAQLPGLLKIRGNSQGRYHDGEWQLAPSALQVEGQLRQQPLTLKAKGETRQQQLRIETDLRYGDNRMHSQGQVWPRWQLRNRLSAPALKQLHSQLSGNLSGQFLIQGPPTQPTFSGSLEGQQLGWEHWRLAALESHFEELGPGSQTQSLSLSAHHLEQHSQTRAETLSLSVNGTLQSHRIALSASEQQLSAKTLLIGGLHNNNQWQGQLRDSEIQHRTLGLWQQRSPSALAIAAQSQSLAPLCLFQDSSELCLNGNRQEDNRIQAQAALTALPLALLDPLTGPAVQLSGSLDGQLSLSGSMDNPQGRLQAHTDSAQLTLSMEDAPSPLAIQTLSLDSTLSAKRVTTQVQLASDLGEAQAALEHGLSADSPLSGQFSIGLDSLSIVELLTPDLRDVNGELKGHMQLAGTVSAPIIDGSLQLNNGHALIPALGTDIQDLSLQLRGSPSGDIDVTGSAKMGDGTVKLAGTMQPSPWPLSLSLSIKGKQLLVANRPDARVVLTPDLILNGDLEGLNLTGSLAIPDANIQPTELPENAVSVSNDQLLIHQQADDNSDLPLTLDVAIQLGDQVRFKGFGLDASLGGNLQIGQQPQQPPQLNGELIVTEGRYRAYGQNLAISDGQLIFQGPADNPGLDIRAIRKVPSQAITVGVQLTGTLQEPQASLFSDPAMEESQIMSYLLTGRGLGNSSGGDSNRIAQALALYGLEKGSGVTAKIGDKLGVDEISVGSDWETDDASLMLGKQLSERLYLTYAIGLFDALSTVMLRYTLTRSLHLEARSSSQANSLDLIWEKELQ